MPTQQTKHFKVALYEAMEQVDPKIIEHLSVQAAIDEALTPTDAYLALSRLQQHCMQANVAVLEFLVAQEKEPFPRRGRPRGPRNKTQG